jgi:hypothetical protein
VIDTAATTVVVSTPFRVTAIKWTVDNGGTDNDTCVLQDKLGVVKYEEILNVITSGYLQAPPISFPSSVLFNGLICPTLSGGKVYIYLADSNNLVA